MTEFKKRDDLLAPDARSSGDLATRHTEMAPLELPAYVPADIRTYFDVTRLLWVYGQLAYPFFAWADLHARIAVERTLRRRLGKDHTRTGLGTLLPIAVQRALLTDAGLAGFHESIDVPLDEKRLEAEVREVASRLGVSAEEERAFESLVKGLVRPFAEARNLSAHQGVARHHTPEDTKETIKLARVLIIHLFRGAPGDSA